jgi:1-acyl-sn-glycerol-3-phosphate acyltransferase
MSVRRQLLRLYHYPANIVSWIVFVAVSCALNLVCAGLLATTRNRTRLGPAVRTAIRRLFAAWCAWLHATRLIFVHFHGFTREALTGPAVYIANHPGLLDATFVLSRLPDTICIFKPAIMRNPALGPAAVMAGYASGDAGVDLIRDVAARLETGLSLLVFPEGTRTAPNLSLNPLKPGFAVIADRANVPIRPILIRAPRDLVPKGWTWWRAPQFPAQVDITLLDEIHFLPDETATELTARIARQFSAALTPP